jgi:hypothetical protein
MLVIRIYWYVSCVSPSSCTLCTVRIKSFSFMINYFLFNLFKVLSWQGIYLFPVVFMAWRKSACGVQMLSLRSKPTHTSLCSVVVKSCLAFIFQINPFFWIHSFVHVVGLTWVRACRTGVGVSLLFSYSELKAITWSDHPCPSIP